MVNFIKKKKFIFGGLFVGLLGGFLYWNFIGCANGHCAIQSSAYLMTAYGAGLGIALGNIIQSYSKS